MESQMSSLPYTQLCRQFSLDEILSVTQNFDDALVVGKGGFGKVYKATITVEKGQMFRVAIKRLNLDSSQGATEFWAEIEMLSKLRHCNLVSLIGYCEENSEMILIYEFMPHGTLDDHLHRYATSLTWVQRLKISIGAARGLHYLHTGTGTQHGVVHRDVKSTNILLDEDYAAKISDFGLAKIGPTNSSGAYVKTDVKGTFGYLDPEYFLTGRLTRKSDVFAFGVVLFELLCGRVALDNRLDEDESSLVKWARESIKKGKVHDIIDLKIKSQMSPKCLKEFVQIAYRCLSSESETRPNMAEIVVTLELSLKLQNKFDTPVKPAAGIFSIGRIIKRPFISHEVISAQSDEKAPTIKEDSSSSSKEDRLNHVAENDKGRSSGMGTICIQRSEGQILSSPNVKPFSFVELKNATRCFGPGNVVGEGRSGTVFKGWIDESTHLASKARSGTPIAVKKLDMEAYETHNNLLEEVMYLCRLHHTNLVKLIGYCRDGNDWLLVYEFMPKGSLEDLFREGHHQPLPWETRLKVAIGIARALTFVHDMKDQIYCDVKPSNILFDGDFNAKLSDISLTKKVRMVEELEYYPGSFIDVYAAPEAICFEGDILDELYGNGFGYGQMTSKSDVYSFGVVLLVLLSGRCPMGKRKLFQQDIVEWAKPALQNRRMLFTIMDPRLKDRYTRKGAFAIAKLASQCLNLDPKSRPPMTKVLGNLEELLAAKNNSNDHHTISGLVP